MIPNLDFKEVPLNAEYRKNNNISLDALMLIVAWCEGRQACKISVLLITASCDVVNCQSKSGIKTV